MQPQRKEVAIFWDYENIQIPARCSSPLTACAEIVRAVSRYGRIQQRRVYFDYSRTDSNVSTWSTDIGESGFDLVSTPRRGTTKTKETLDRKMINDIIFFAWDVLFRGGSPCVVLITSDGDFAYTINKLRDRGATNVVIHGSSASRLLTASADVALHLETHVLLESLRQPGRPITPDCDYTHRCRASESESRTNEPDLEESLAHFFVEPSISEVCPADDTTEASFAPDYPVVSSSSTDITNSSSKEQSYQDAVKLCRAVICRSIGWVFQGKAGVDFREAIAAIEPTATKADLTSRFRDARYVACEAGWAIQGRQLVLPDGSKGGVVSTHSALTIVPEGLSTHTYIKLTEAGEALVKGTPPALVDMPQSGVDSTKTTNEVTTQRDAKLFCEALILSSPGWVLGSQVGDRFRAAIDASGPNTAEHKRARYRAASTRVIANGWAVQGHSQLLPDGTEGEIVITSGTSRPHSESLSKTQYVKVTRLGLLFLDSKTLAVSEIPANKTLAPAAVEPDVTKCLFVKNISNTVGLAALVYCVEKMCHCTVVQAFKILPHPCSAFYFVRLILHSSQHAANLLRIANSQGLELHGRILTATYDRSPFLVASKSASSDPNWWYFKGGDVGTSV